MTLCLTNTLKRTKEPFAPANPDHVTMHVCGPTVHNFAHVGNARPAVAFHCPSARPVGRDCVFRAAPTSIDIND